MYNSLLSFFPTAYGQATSTVAELETVIESGVADITTMVLTGVGAVLGLVAALIGFMYAFRFLVARIGSPRG